MKNDINLIDVKQRPKAMGQDLVLIGSVGIFAVIFVISIFILLLSFLGKSQLSALNTDVNNLKAKMSIVSSQKDKINTITNRVTSIKKIISTRRAIDAKVDDIISAIPSSFAINDFKAGDAQVSMAVTSTSLSDFDSLLEVKIPQITKNKALGINHIDIGSFAQEQDGYSLALTFYFTP